MATTESRHDYGFQRALLCGVSGFVACLAVWRAYSGAMPPPETEGRLLATFLMPAVLTGLIVKGRRWSWGRVAALYTVTAVTLTVVTVFPKLREKGI
jgi:hypothetical protein